MVHNATCHCRECSRTLHWLLWQLTSPSTDFQPCSSRAPETRRGSLSARIWLQICCSL